MKKTKRLMVGIFCTMLCLFMGESACQILPQKAYGIFLGLNGDETDRMAEYDFVVIEPSEFSAEQVEILRKTGKVVYGYLNIGSVETYRPYYAGFQNETLSVYED